MRQVHKPTIFVLKKYITSVIHDYIEINSRYQINITLYLKNELSLLISDQYLEQYNDPISYMFDIILQLQIETLSSMASEQLFRFLGSKFFKNYRANERGRAMAINYDHACQEVLKYNKMMKNINNNSNSSSSSSSMYSSSSGSSSSSSRIVKSVSGQSFLSQNYNHNSSNNSQRRKQQQQVSSLSTVISSSPILKMLQMSSKGNMKSNTIDNFNYKNNNNNNNTNNSYRNKNNDININNKNAESSSETSTKSSVKDYTKHNSFISFSFTLRKIKESIYPIEADISITNYNNYNNNTNNSNNNNNNNNNIYPIMMIDDPLISACAHIDKDDLMKILELQSWFTVLIAAVENLPLSFSLCKPVKHGRKGFPLIYVNKYYEKMMGFKRLSVLGKIVTNLVSSLIIQVVILIILAIKCLVICKYDEVVICKYTI